MTACERAQQRKSQDEWLNATLLGAAFDSGDLEKAQQLAELMAVEGPASWKLETTLRDCKLAAELFEEPRRTQLLAIAARLSALIA
jgi:hypothetical protein